MRSFPWDSLVVSMGDDGFPIYDRDYMASDLREVYETFFSNGVFLDTEDALQVTVGEGMTVHVAPGKCCIRGTVGYEKSIRELALQASSSQDRIDTVVLRWNANVEMRNIDLYVKSGVASATPVAPTLTRSETVYELGLADIFVSKNSGAVSAARITDTRMNTDRCGIVTPLVKIDMTSFYETMQAALAELEAKLDEQTQIAVDLAQNALDETMAGHLQSQITENKQAIEANSALDDERWDALSQKPNIQLAISKQINIGSYQSSTNFTETIDIPEGYRIGGIIGIVVPQNSSMYGYWLWEYPEDHRCDAHAEIYKDNGASEVNGDFIMYVNLIPIERGYL